MPLPPGMFAQCGTLETLPVGTWSAPSFFLMAARYSVRAAVPNLFGTRDWFHGRQFFHGR